MSKPWITILPQEFSLRGFLRLLERSFAVIGFLAFVYHGAFHLSAISSGSMTPTLQGEALLQGDVVLSERISYKLRQPHRWEIILFREPDFNMQIMKRVIGLPGEKVALDDRAQTFYINGAPVERPASLRGMKYLAYGSVEKGKTAACGEGYYVLGDHSMDSMDSRWTGPVMPAQIRARPWLVVWPPSRVGFVNP